jgi:ribosome production factor 2
MDALGDKTGRIHLGKQDLGQLQTRKMKGLKRGRGDEDSVNEGVAGGRMVVNGDHEMENGAADEDIFEGDEEEDDEEEEEGSNPFDSDDSGGVEFLDEVEGDKGDIERVTVTIPPD